MSDSLSDLHLPVIPLSALPAALTAGVGLRDAEDAVEVGRGYLVLKPWLEAVLAALLLVLLAPVMLLAALLVKLTSRGPALYTQIRLGQHGRPYRIYKLRTMYQDAEAATGAVWASDGDPRVTPVGRVLRATHIDELPQLVNVLCSDMSLSGPRPERPEIVRYLEMKLPHYAERLRVRPGITGLAQVQLPPDVDLRGVRKKLVCDLYYIEHFGAALDWRILICTGLYFLGAPLAFSRRLLRIPELERMKDEG
jgi:lipopolysaccharide/colanic/teichoic acid biosynthesis glycosyltransferase